MDEADNKKAAQHPLPTDEDGRIEMVEEFTSLIASCRGKVFFRTSEGDSLVADSMLSALIGFRTLLAMADRIKLTFACEYKEDEDRLQAFLRKHNIENGA